MSNPSLYIYPSPLEGFENLPPLPDEKNEDGKSFQNPPNDKLDDSYHQFVTPIESSSRGGFDVHIYYFQNNPEQAAFATALWERIRRSFPELRIYRIWDKPIGPHTVAMFEVDIFTPAQFGAFIPWLVINRGPLSALVHPNTGDDERDHTQRATWMGERIALDLGIFTRMRQATAKLKAVQAERVEVEKTQG
ncbi:hypothetical protein MMC22_000863 [Lobaria immixta]|nr:hypothetical protein [Lobaria immixta]